MTNKKCEGIDCAWCMSIECPKERKTEMTDKEQIIIDGIAVRNCDFFLSSNKYCGLYSTGCRFVPNCHFKQLARKTQECEELRKKEFISNPVEAYENVVKQLARKTQECEDLKLCLQQSKDNNKSTLKLLENKHTECEKLKEEQNEIKKFLGISQKTIMQRLEELHERSDKYKDRILELGQECEELKKELATYKKMLDDPEFRVALTDVKTGEREVWRKLGNKADSYHKALEEIEEVFREDHGGDYDYIKWRIDDIIDKAKG